MRFQPIYLYGKQETGKDVLGNPIFELVQIGESEGRFSTWTAEEIALDTRSVTANNRKIVTRASRASLLETDKIKIDDLFHSVKDVKGDDYSRWRILIVNRYGSDGV